MGFFETFKLALKNIASNKLRTFLTMLGIVIGVCAVIVIIGLGNGMTKYIEDQFSTMGSNSLTIMLLGRGSSRMVTEEQMYEIVEKNPDLLDKISPTVTVNGGLKIGNETFRTASVTGVSEDYFSMKDYAIAQGRGLQYIDIAERKPVCVVGAYVNETHFAGAALGQTLRVGTHALTVVGIMEAEADEPEEGGTDDCVFLPYSTAARYSRTGIIRNYTITVTDPDLSTQAKVTVENGLYKVYEDTDAYTVISMSEVLDLMSSLVDIVITVLAIIAGISLVVGGIGIMNIMLVSVTERTREIGIRKALGAKEGVILRQFVLEAATTSALGGVLGIGLGYALSSFATVIIQAMMDTGLQVTPSAGAIALSFGVSAGIGVIFGYLPARKAARLNPIDALRYE